MIHYHGSPITPDSVALSAIAGGHAFVSFRRPDQFALVIEICQSFAVDNGAFTAWKSGAPVRDWRKYYAWIGKISRLPTFDFAVIPDSIDGTEADNDALIREWPYQGPRDRALGAPVWHMHESLERLERLAYEWPRICIGSSGDYSIPGNPAWWSRMHESMLILCKDHASPICKIHGLRMLNVKIFTRLPLASADSTNIARNAGIDSKWKGTYSPVSREMRAAVLRGRIETYQALNVWDPAEIMSK